MRKIAYLGIIPMLALMVFACQKNDLKTPELTADAKGGKSNVYDNPTVTCASATLYSISLTVTAGNSGAPSGFSVQWLKAADYYGTYNGVWPTDDNAFCKASFSGNANGSRYNLTANESVTVNVGSFLMDNGASFSAGCGLDLDPCTEYVFRVFVHGDSKKNRSEYVIKECSTSCGSTACGRQGYGYWKENCPEDGLTISGVTYTAAEICTILNTRAQGNGLLILAHQVITAKLNGLDITAAETAIGGRDFRTGSEHASWQAGLVGTLKGSNENCD